MALLRLTHFPSTTLIPNEHQQQQHSCLQNSRYSINGCKTKLSLSSLSHTQFHILSFGTRRVSNLVLQFSSNAQQQAPDSSLSSVEETEEFSRTKLVAQNLPWTSSPQDIRALFEKYGTVLDIELSMYNKTRNRGLAFVTMGSPEEALVARDNLESCELEGRSIRVDFAKIKKKKPSSLVKPKPVTFNLFAANLSYEATAEDLNEFFDSRNVVSAKIVYHDNPKRSLGYGFVAFKSKKDAEEALAAFEGKTFMGRPIRLARSKQFAKVPTEESESETTTTELNGGSEQADTANEN